MAPAAVVCVVDDDPSVRTSLARLIGSAGYAVQTFGSADDFLARKPWLGPCCIVLDVRMPGATGLDLQRALAAAIHRIPIVFITGHGTVPMSVAAMKGGAVDFLTKPFAPRELLDAVERAVSQDRRDLDVETRIAEIQARIDRLTARERQVFALVVTGMLNKQIASELGIVEKTVKVHRGRVMAKLRATSFAELVRLADSAGVCRTPA
jgi:FixJ family two-component response regulator